MATGWERPVRRAGRAVRRISACCPSRVPDPADRGTGRDGLPRRVVESVLATAPGWALTVIVVLNAVQAAAAIAALVSGAKTECGKHRRQPAMTLTSTTTTRPSASTTASMRRRRRNRRSAAATGRRRAQRRQLRTAHRARPSPAPTPISFRRKVNTAAQRRAHLTGPDNQCRRPGCPDFGRHRRTPDNTRSTPDNRSVHRRRECSRVLSHIRSSSIVYEV